MNEQENSAAFSSFSIDGHFQDGVTSRSVPAKLFVHAHGAQLVAEDVSLDFLPENLSLTDRVGDTPRRIQWEGDAAFITSDNDAVDRLQLLLPGGTLGRVAFRLESNLTLAIAALVVVAVLLGVTMLWGVPKGASYLAAKIPAPLAERAGDNVLETLDELYLAPSKLSTERTTELRSYLFAQDEFPQRIEFRFAGERFGPNAFALPGGYVVITDELINLAENDEEILAVYLHEVGHARNHHAETGVLANSAWLVILTIVTGDISGMTEAIFSVPVVLGQLAFSRELEREADDYSIEKLKELSLNPDLLATILERMSTYRPGTPESSDEDQSSDKPEDNSSVAETTGSSLFDYLSTHPSTTERLARIRAAAQ